ncbi:MAG: hypothetical protein IKT55_05090 [Clostridia bacterium]|nr:hypothetical protein [Clostridia bacterium]
MKTLKKYKILQMLMGVFLGCIVLSVGLILTRIATWEQLPIENLLSKIILTVFPVMFTAGMTAIAVISKSNDLKFIYYPAFIVNMCSLSSAIFWYLVDSTMGTVFRHFFSFSKTIGSPFYNYATAVTEKLTYTVNYDGWTDEYSIMPEIDVLMILLLCLLASVVAYQLYRDNDEHREKISRRRLENPARSLAISVICFYGAYILFIMLSNLIGVVADLMLSVPVLYDVVCGVLDIVIMVFFWGGYVILLSGMIIILPIVITFALIIICIIKAVKTKNPHQLFNPLVLLAIVLSISGSILMYTFVCSGF